MPLAGRGVAFVHHGKAVDRIDHGVPEEKSRVKSETRNPNSESVRLRSPRANPNDQIRMTKRGDPRMDTNQHESISMRREFRDAEGAEKFILCFFSALSDSLSSLRIDSCPFV